MQAWKFKLQYFSRTARYIHSVKNVDSPCNWDFHLSLTWNNDPGSLITYCFLTQVRIYSQQTLKFLILTYVLRIFWDIWNKIGNHVPLEPPPRFTPFKKIMLPNFWFILILIFYFQYFKNFANYQVNEF